MRRLPLMVLGVLLGTAFVIAQVTVSQPRTKSKVEQFSDPSVPETVVIRATLADKALICAEPVKGLVACRSVGEFRAWVTQRPARGK